MRKELGDLKLQAKGMELISVRKHFGHSPVRKRARGLGVSVGRRLTSYTLYC